MITTKLNWPYNNNKTIIALGAESDGGFCILSNNTIHIYTEFGDLLNDKNFNNYKNMLLLFLKKNKLSPQIVISDIHPSYRSSQLCLELKNKFSAQHFHVQHHQAHISSVFGEMIINNKNFIKTSHSFKAIACDGTGLGFDDKIWGGEVFSGTLSKNKLSFNHIGRLEYLSLIGGDKAIQEPARILISILDKFLTPDGIYIFLKKYYTKKQFSLLFKMYKNNFNCTFASSTGRALDAVSIMLGFSQNKRKYKHYSTLFLENLPNLKVIKLQPLILRGDNNLNILSLKKLFNYLFNNLDKDKNSLALTAEHYLINGLFTIAKLNKTKDDIYVCSGGLSKIKYFKHFLQKNNIISNKLIPAGDAGISFGQLVYVLLTNSRN